VAKSRFIREKLRLIQIRAAIILLSSAVSDSVSSVTSVNGILVKFRLFSSVKISQLAVSSASTPRYRVSAWAA
jgi:hypothetical protein